MQRYKLYGHIRSIRPYSGWKKQTTLPGRSYGKKNPRFCRMMKSIYKSGVIAAIGGNNFIDDYYEHLIKEKNYPAYNARNKACRRLATISFGVFKSGKKYSPYRTSHVK